MDKFDDEIRKGVEVIDEMRAIMIAHVIDGIDASDAVSFVNECRSLNSLSTSLIVESLFEYKSYKLASSLNRVSKTNCRSPQFRFSLLVCDFNFELMRRLLLYHNGIISLVLKLIAV